ncbi:uncharacterized protein LOC114415943 [Glycine soja]|uniref:uncharacterized protein LOC114415943 n=1 Tax=Glycine soja TaxID=3848 RepID=UPI00103FD4EB|nr:uncharacterized protein LOC114415943 [Glycine soja]
MTADARDLAEDVADMTEDVPDLVEEAPEMRADVQGVDGAEGSDADDAEGFPSGPRDPSVLTSFADHVAHAKRSDLKLVSHGRKVTLIVRPVPEIEGLVGATRLSPLMDCSVVTEEAIFLLTELLEVSAEEARAETTLTRETYVQLGWVRDIYEMRCQVRRWIVAARVYLLHLVGCILFANKSATYMHVVHLDAFRDLGQSGGYAWGVVALCWIYEHFPSVQQCVTDDTYQETSPSASRAFEVISSFQGQLRWGPMVVTARPERLVRQFGYIQSIPPPSVSARLSHDDIDDN